LIPILVEIESWRHTVDNSSLQWLVRVSSSLWQNTWYFSSYDEAVRWAYEAYGRPGSDVTFKIEGLG